MVRGRDCHLLADSLALPAARKESAKEKQLKEEEKILESVAEGRGERWELDSQSCQGSSWGYYLPCSSQGRSHQDGQEIPTGSPLPTCLS